MKKIVFISPTGTLDNGAEKSTLNLMKYLVELGYIVYNVFPSNEHPTYQRYLEIQESFGIKVYPLQTLNWWWEEAPGFKHCSKQERSLFYRQNIWRIRSLIQQEKIDIVVSVTANVFEGAVAAACENVSHVWMIHEFPREEFAYYRQKIDFMANNSKLISCVRGNLFNELISLFPENSKLIDFIPYTSLIETELQSSNEVRLVSIGRINDNKNQMELLQAYAKSQLTHLPLLFIGEWEDTVKQTLDDYIEKFALENVLFLGFQDNPWDLISENDICIFNSKSESFSLVYLESILNAVPSIVSNNDGYQTVHSIFDSGIMYNLGDLDALVDALHHLVNNFSKYKEISLENQIEAKKKYTIANCYKQFVNQIEQLDNQSSSDLLAIESLFLSPMDKILFNSVTNDKISIFYTEEENSVFLPDKCLTFPLELSGEIMFSLPKKAKKVRIDTGEKPGEFHEVSLRTYDDLELVPCFSTGFKNGNSYLFEGNDPQMIFDISGISDSEFIFSYQISQILDDVRHHMLLDTLSNSLEQIEKIKVLEEENSQLMKTLDVIQNSKRWKITSKIINFFRRNQ